MEVNTRGLAVSSAGHTESVMPVARVVSHAAHPAVGTGAPAQLGLR